MAVKSNRFDVAVDGDDVPAMLAALECARFGFRVAVVRSVEQRPLPTTLSAVGGHIAALCDELGLRYTVDRLPEGEWNILGVPVNPFATNVVQALGWRGAWRVYLDRLMPLLAIGNEPNLRRLVTKRIGAKAWSALVEPALVENFGRASDKALVDEAAHGLSQAMSRVGSLTAGVLELAAADNAQVEFIAVDGGASALASALQSRLEFFAANFVDDGKADRLDATIWIEGVAATDEQPSWVRQIPRAREAAAQARHTLLSDPENPPVGPVDLER